jgi:hypothetical protein
MSAHDGHAPAVSDRETARRLDGEIARSREELSALTAELDRRRHEILDVRGQVKRHALGASMTGAALTGAAFAVRWLAVQHVRRRARLTARAGRLGAAVTRIIETPERVATGMTIWRKVIAAVATAVSVTAARALIGWGVRALVDRRDIPSLDSRRPPIPIGDSRHQDPERYG